MARGGHNHWVVQRLEWAARRHNDSPDNLLAWVDAIGRTYLAAPAAPEWKRAVSAAWVVIRRAAERTRSATSSPT